MGYRRGTTIYRCLPFSYVVSESVKSLVCDFCLRSHFDENIAPNNETMKRCSGCKTVYYCQGKLSTIQHKYIFVKLISRKIIITYLNTYFIFLASCQKNAWLTYHREECMYLRKVAPKIPPDSVRLMARIILKLRNGGAKECDVLPDGQQRYFDDLLTHQKEIVRDSSRIEAFQNFYLVLKDCLDKLLPPKAEVLDIFGRILINSFNLMNDKFQSVGVG